MNTSFQIRTIRSRIKKDLQNKTVGWLLSYLQADNIETARENIIQKRRSAFISSKKRSGDAICWNCIHATSKYDKCSWSMDLSPRKDWSQDCLVKCRDNNNDLYIVCNCPGFILDDQDSLCRQTVENILGDFFYSYSNLLGKEYFETVDVENLLSWVKIYNSLTKMAGVAELKLYQKNKEEE